MQEGTHMNEQKVAGKSVTGRWGMLNATRGKIV